MIAERVAGASFLDLFAGSGAVGIEAWSRGARSVWWVEADTKVGRTLNENVARLCLKGDAARADREARVLIDRAEDFLGNGPAARRFDIVFADPPYAETRRGSEMGWDAILLDAAAETRVLEPGGLFVLETGRSRDCARNYARWNMIKIREYGDTVLMFFEQEGAK